MTAINAGTPRYLYRDRDRALLGGVCAGLARFLGFNLRVTRILAFIAFLMAMPVAVIAYIAAVFLIPSESHGDAGVANNQPGRAGMMRSRRRRSRKRRSWCGGAREYDDAAERTEPAIANEIDRRCESLDDRLKRLEKHVTSKRFQLDQELSRL